MLGLILFMNSFVTITLSEQAGTSAAKVKRKNVIAHGNVGTTLRILLALCLSSFDILFAEFLF